MNTELYHYGVLGMKWGRRKNRVLNEKQQRKAETKAIKKDRKNASKNRYNLSDQELNARVERLKKEKQLKELTNENIAPGKTAVNKFLSSTGGRVATAAATGALAYAGNAYLKSKGWDQAASYVFPNPNKKK